MSDINNYVRISSFCRTHESEFDEAPVLKSLVTTAYEHDTCLKLVTKNDKVFLNNVNGTANKTEKQREKQANIARNEFLTELRSELGNGYTDFVSRKLSNGQSFLAGDAKLYLALGIAADMRFSRDAAGAFHSLATNLGQSELNSDVFLDAATSLTGSILKQELHDFGKHPAVDDFTDLPGYKYLRSALGTIEIAEDTLTLFDTIESHLDDDLRLRFLQKLTNHILLSVGEGLKADSETFLKEYANEPFSEEFLEQTSLAIANKLGYFAEVISQAHKLGWGDDQNAMAKLLMSASGANFSTFDLEKCLQKGHYIHLRNVAQELKSELFPDIEIDQLNRDNLAELSQPLAIKWESIGLKPDQGILEKSDLGIVLSEVLYQIVEDFILGESPDTRIEDAEERVNDWIEWFSYAADNADGNMPTEVFREAAQLLRGMLHLRIPFTEMKRPEYSQGIERYSQMFGIDPEKNVLLNFFDAASKDIRFEAYNYDYDTFYAAVELLSQHEARRSNYYDINDNEILSNFSINQYNNLLNKKSFKEFMEEHKGNSPEIDLKRVTDISGSMFGYVGLIGQYFSNDQASLPETLSSGNRLIQSQYLNPLEEEEFDVLLQTITENAEAAIGDMNALSKNLKFGVEFFSNAALPDHMDAASLSILRNIISSLKELDQSFNSDTGPHKTIKDLMSIAKKDPLRFAAILNAILEHSHKNTE
ncbi:hypothetical protein [Roseibium sp.]|uniref:hypothetical protein n=1 Tax=Roseibium sp. TaxID=1936156 RepID=UPI00326457B7